MNARIRFKLQVTAMPRFHSLYQWCFPTMWLFSGAPEDPENDTVMEKHCTEALYSTLKNLMHAIGTEIIHTQLDTAHRMIIIAMPWTIRRRSNSKLANGKPLVLISKENAHLVDLEWSEVAQATLKTLVERYTSQGSSGGWRVPRWQLACFSLVFGDTEDRNDISGQGYDEWQLKTWVDSPIFRSLRDTFLPMLVKEHAEYPAPDKDQALHEALLHKPESNKSALPLAHPVQKAVLFRPLPGLVGHLKCWLTKCFEDHLDVFHMYTEMGNDERTEMRLKFHDSPNPSVFVTTSTVGSTGRNLTAANNAVITQTFWVLNERR